MADLDAELTASSTVKITGGAEDYIADVIEEDSKKKLRVKTDFEVSSSLRIIEAYDQNVTLPDNSYYTIYTTTGEKAVSGIIIRFDDKKVFVKLEIDGQTIFDMNIEKFKEIVDYNSAPYPSTYVSWNDGDKTFFFTPVFPIKANSSVTISARSKTGQSKKYLASVVQVG